MNIDECDEVIFEYWDVAEPDQPEWLNYYRTIVVGALRQCAGYAGSVFLKEEPAVRPGPRRVVGPHFGSRLLGVRTNAAVNLSNLLQHEYTYLVVHFMREKNPSLLHEFFEGWKRMVPDWREQLSVGDEDTGNDLWLNHLNSIYVAATEDREPGDREESRRASIVMSRQLFGIVNNHWDVMYDVAAYDEAAEPGSTDEVGVLSGS